VRFGFIRDHRNEFHITSMCRVLRVSPSGFHAWLGRPESDRSKRHRCLLVDIRAVSKRTRQSYGSPRIHAELVDLGHKVGRHQVADIMRQNGVRARRKKKFRVTTDSNHDHPIAPNILDRDFSADAPNQAWVGDITYVWTKEGWLFLAVLLDLFSRRVVGWATSDTIDAGLVGRALQKAIALRRPPKGIVIHHDRGSQYASKDYRNMLKSIGAVASMSRKGDCWDNAVSESFFGSLKTEWVPEDGYETKEDGRRDLFNYIEGFYNRERRHSTIGYLSPVAMEATVDVR
jgi:putative transposase